MDIVPVILADNIEEFDRKLELAKNCSTYIQIDFMDGKFTPKKSILPADLSQIRSDCEFEAHLMVSEPVEHLDALKAASIKRVIFHVEPVGDPFAVVEKIKNEGMLPGIAVSPLTSVYPVRTILNDIDTLLLLAVDPQIENPKFYPEVTNKLDFLDSFTDLRIGIDGGIKRSNIKKILDKRVRYVCAGSAIFDSGDPYSNYSSLKHAIQTY